MKNIDIDLYTQQSELTSSEENIVIEITGLKSINKFIGLDDTPLYYEDGKFFKVEGNKIVYTDIEWKDLKGDVTDNKDLIEQIEVNAEKSAKKYAGQIVASAIDIHNNDVNSHPYLLNTIQENYNTLDEKIDNTKTELETSISDLDQKLSKDIDDLDIKLSGEIEDLTQDLSDEITNRENADIEINKSITQLDEKVDGINANLTQQIDELQQDVNDKYDTLVDDIDDLSDIVDENYDTLDTKIDTTTTTINQRITDVADELNQTIEENVVALQQEDTALQNQINAHATTLTAYDTRITANANAITQEVVDRQNADNNLQEQIDGITAGADVRDIVGTYADLQAYDKSKLGDNDIIKVLNDETKENASTYYRFGFTAQLFTYIGKEGPFYTKSENDTLLNNKANKDDLLNFGSKLIYENSILDLINGEGDTLSSVTIKSTPDLDNKTISLNSDSELQSIGSVLKSGGYQTYWCGTKAEYDAIVTKDNDTLYEVLDEINDIVTEIPTATLDDIGLCKPDGNTITVDDTGTLSIPSTFLLNHNSSNLAHTDLFSAKANVNLNNVNSAYDFAIYSVTYGGGESGYEKYRNKKLVQWGVTNASASGESEITMHTPFKDMNYSVFIEMREQGDFFHYAIPSGVQKFKVRVKGANGSFYGARLQWRAYGYYQ